jgi:hypothetical protein
MKTSQKLLLATLLTFTLLSYSVKAEDIADPALETGDDQLHADVANEIDASRSVTKESEESLHEDDIEHAALKKKIVEIHLADKEKMYNYQEILDVTFRYFVEEPLSEVAKHRLLHDRKEHDEELEPMLVNAAMVEHYLEHELDGRTELSAQDLEGLLNHHKYDNGLQHNEEGLHSALNKYASNDPEDQPDNEADFDELEDIDVDDDDEDDEEHQDDEDDENDQVQDYEIEDM